MRCACLLPPIHSSPTEEVAKGPEIRLERTFSMAGDAAQGGGRGDIVMNSQSETEQSRYERVSKRERERDRNTAVVMLLSVSHYGVCNCR